ncbi:MAG TPA: DUF512 domain-containing protein, partial [Chthonomonadales bacterium]|nr:DUF512 domain-containing protein [Chthonomonadales bacterium]
MPETIPLNQSSLAIAALDPKGPAARAGVRAGDRLLRINGSPVLDILDYRFHSASANPTFELERQGSSLALRVRKAVETDAGIEFEQDLADRIHTCKNKCVFCFIHQMPKKMRRSLYLMDDDFRLSFMHGNYVTLTNLSRQEWARIKEQRLSPLYVSVHSTDPALRGVLLGRREPAPVLPQLRELAEAGINVHAQIVLCPGMNDGESLLQTIDELRQEHPSQTGRRYGVMSVAIVPVGLTRFRERLPRVKHVEKHYAGELIRKMRALERRLLPDLGTRFVWLADEWYFLAGINTPGMRHYEEFPQLEDGVGTVRLFLDEAKRLYNRLPAGVSVPVRA